MFSPTDTWTLWQRFHIRPGRITVTSLESEDSTYSSAYSFELYQSRDNDTIVASGHFEYIQHSLGPNRRLESMDVHNEEVQKTCYNCFKQINLFDKIPSPNLIPIQFYISYKA